MHCDMTGIIFLGLYTFVVWSSLFIAKTSTLSSVDVTSAKGTRNNSTAINPAGSTKQMTSITTKPVEITSSSVVNVTRMSSLQKDLTTINPIPTTTQKTTIIAKPEQDKSSCGTNKPVIHSCQEGQSPINSTIFLRFRTKDKQRGCICHVNGTAGRNIRVKPLKIIPERNSGWNISITDGDNETVIAALSHLRIQEYSFVAKQGVPSKFDMRGLQIDVCLKLQYVRETRSSYISVKCEKSLRDDLTTFAPAPTTTHTTSITVKADDNNATTQSSDISKTFTRPTSDTDFTSILLGVSVGIFVLLLTGILSAFFICRKQRRKQKVKTPQEEAFIYGMRDNVLYGTTSDKQEEEPFVYGMRENILYEGFDTQNQCLDKMDATTQSNDQNGKQKEFTHVNQQMVTESHTKDDSLGVNVYSEVRKGQIVKESTSTAQPRVELSSEDRNTFNDVYSEVHKVK